MNNFKPAALALTLALGTSTAFANPVVTINEDDAFYNPGGFTATIDSTATGSAATVNFLAAVFGADFTIDFTNASGTITNVLESDTGVLTGAYAGDSLEFFGAASGDPLIGTSCAADFETACVVTTGGVQDLTSTIGEFNGGQGVYFGDMTVQIEGTAATPEPSSFVLLGTGLLTAAGAARRRFLKA